MIIKLESDYWDCEYSISDLIKYNENKCLIDVNYRKHESDSCFGRFALLFKSPKRNDNTYFPQKRISKQIGNIWKILLKI